MELQTCEKCRKLFYYLTGECLCTDCRRNVEAEFQKADQYVAVHHDASIAQVSSDCHISEPQVKTWIKEEKLHTIDERNVYSVCERCGKSIPRGNFCRLCKYQLMNGIKNALDIDKEQNMHQKPAKTGHAQMHFVKHDR